MVELTDAVSAFLDHVLADIRRRRGVELDKGQGTPVVRPLPPAVRHWFEEAEATAPWEGLVRACSEAFSPDGHGRSESFWRHALKHWFRRSGAYLGCLNSSPTAPRALTERLVADIRCTEEKVLLLALMEGVRFARTSMSFGEFTVFKPDRTELEALLGVEVNRVFYPHAITSTNRLTDQWYVRAQTSQDRRKIGRIYFRDPFTGPVQPQYTHFAPVMEAALKRVVLWDWYPDYFDRPPTNFEGEGPWHGFSIPFVIAVSDDPFRRPPPAPPIDALYYEPEFDPSGEEIGERPGALFTLSAADTSHFEGFLREIGGQLREINEVGDAWSFVDLALSYVIKGFFTDGLEQMLWHIVALEVLLGENRPRITDRLSRRLASVYSDDEALNSGARAAFTKLYGLRGELVHGRPFKAEVHRGHLRIARTLARVAALRMLKLLTHILGERRNRRLDFLPSREEVLQALDFDRQAATRLADLLRSILPALAATGPSTAEP